jgi:rubrerythrin
MWGVHAAEHLERTQLVTDSAVADHADPDRPTRRALFGAGVIGAALAMAGSRSASAATNGLSERDIALAEFAIALELTARDLYDAAIEAGATGEVWSVMREQHESYAQRLSGITGSKADTRNDAVYFALVDSFRSTTSDAAFNLENTAAATHIELIGEVGDVDTAAAMASMAAMESRHAVVLAGLAGKGGDLDAMFLNTATPLAPEA